MQTLVNTGDVFVKSGLTTSSAVSADTTGHVVNFYDGNKLISKQFVAHGANAEAPAMSKIGFVFMSWTGSYTNVTEDVNVYAQWKTDVKNNVGSYSDSMSSYGVTLANGKSYDNATALLGKKIVLESGTLGGGASPETGGGTIEQSYLAFNGSYALNDYIVLDFTGKNMPEIAFFANNYDSSMYSGNNANDDQKTGIVVYTGITDNNGHTVNVNVDKPHGTVINYSSPYMLNNTGDGSFCAGAHAQSALGRQNLVDGKRYRVIMGFTGSGSAITLQWYLYDLDTKTVVEQSSMTTWNFFTGSNAQVDNMTINDLSGSIVVYGKFATHTVLDNVYEIFEDTDISKIATTLGMKCQSLILGTGALGNTSGDLSDLGGYAGNNANDNGRQDYCAIKGNYSFDDYVAFDFTGKNMPEMAFFAKNYDNYMYSENGGKQGVVVASGITAWNSDNYSPVGNGCQNVVVSGPYMANFQSDGGGWAAKGISINIMSAIEQAKLARANLVEGKHYRVIMGFSKASESAITLNYLLYDLDTNTILENVSQQSWGVFNNSSTNFYKQTTTELFGDGGDIVLYGKFAVTTTIDKIWGVYEDTTITDVCGELGITSTITYKNYDGTVLQETVVPYGRDAQFEGSLPTRAGDLIYSSYTFNGWQKETVGKDVVYVASFTGIEGSANMNNVTFNGASVVLGWGNIGDGANYTVGQNSGGSVTQAYVAFDGNYGFNDYIVLDFTGKNMPEIMFFANNYDTSMYYSEGKQGIVVASGITLYNGTTGSAQTNNTKVGVSGPFGAYYEGAAAPHGGNMMSDFSAQLARENLVDGVQYRIIMGFVNNGTTFTLKYYLYNLTDGVVVENLSKDSWAFFTGTNDAVNSMTLEGFSGSIVLYGKFQTTCTIDKVWGVFEDTTIAEITEQINKEYTVTFTDEGGNVLQEEKMPYGSTPYYFGEIPERADDLLGSNYEFAWDKELALVTGDVTYKATYTYDSHASNATLSGEGVVLGWGNIGDGANYKVGQNSGGSVTQAYVAFDGNYGFNDYIVLDFTGKNMPEIMFFANNYDTSMYYSEGKQGIVVASGITLYNGTTGSAQTNNTKVGVSGPFGAYYEGAAAPHGGNMMSDFSAQLARENLVDGVQYRIIMGFVNNGTTFTLKYYLYNLTDGVVVENLSKDSWAFFTGTNDAVNSMTLEGFSGSIVLYGKFQTTCTIDKVWGVYEDTTLDTVVEEVIPTDETSGEGETPEQPTTDDLLGYDKYTDQFDFYAYGSYSDGWYEIDGTKYYIGKNLGTLKQYSLYGGAGLTIYFPQDAFKITEDPQTIVKAKKLIDDLAKVGITKTILNDARLSWLSLLETMDSRFTTDGVIDNDKLKEYVKSCLEPYATYPGVYGIQLGDEPKYSVLNSYVAVYNAIKDVCAENEWNLHIQYNLNPMLYDNNVFNGGYYGPGNGKNWNSIIGTDNKVAETKARYLEYIEAFLNGMNPDSIMYDDYPLLKEDGDILIRDLYIANLQIVAQECAERGIKFYHVTQAFENEGDTKLRRQVTEKGAQWMNNMLLGFGVKQIVYYTYYTRYSSDSTGNESYVDGSSFVDYNGNPTDFYYTMQGIMANNQIFAKVIMQFNYKQSAVYWNKSGILDFAPDYISYATSTGSFAKATVAYATKNVGALVTELYDDENNNYMYMAMNIDDPDASSSTATITLTFSDYTKALVYDGNGGFKTVTLSSGGVYTCELTPGQAVYVIPY